MTQQSDKQSGLAPYDIRQLAAGDRPRIARHLLALDKADRLLRFGFISDAAAVARYVDAIDFGAGAVFGAVDRRTDALVGMAHVGFDAGVADLGLSVSSEARRVGVGSALASLALREAQRRGAHEFRFDGVAGNSAMRRLAMRLDMPVSARGSEFIASRALNDASHDEPELAAS